MSQNKFYIVEKTWDGSRTREVSKSVFWKLYCPICKIVRAIYPDHVVFTMYNKYYYEQCHSEVF